MKCDRAVVLASQPRKGGELRQSSQHQPRRLATRIEMPETASAAAEIVEKTGHSIVEGRAGGQML